MAEYLKLTNDIVFQRIFGKVGNENITKAFLEKILGIKIEELTLDTNKRLIGEEIEDKIGRVDVKAKLQDGTKVIIEMQVTEYSYMVKRLLYYWSRVYVGDLKRGKEYDYKCQYINEQKIQNKNVQKCKLCNLRRFIFYFFYFIFYSIGSACNINNMRMMQ